MKLFIAIVGALWICLVSGKTLNLFDGRKFDDCTDVRNAGYSESGIYLVYLNESEPIPVQCGFNATSTRTAFLIQKYGRVSFKRTYADYENGFGSASAGDFWMGLRYIKYLTDKGNKKLIVTLQDWQHVIKTIYYNYFSLGPQYDRYRLTVSGYMSSNVLPDDFSFNNGWQFATYDYPDPNQCASMTGAGWWYNYCTFTLPTGHYYNGGPYTPSGKLYDGIFYNDWLGYGYSYKYISLELTT